MATGFGSARLDDDITGLDGSRAPGEGEFSKGLRGGFESALGQANSFISGGAEALGLDGFAANRRAASEVNQAEAARIGSTLRAGSLSDVKDIRSAFDFAAGTAGQLVPNVAGSLGAGLVGGLAAGPAGAIAGATAFNAPLAAGDIIQRQLKDPEVQNLGAGERFGRAAVGGLASSAVESAVPALFGAKLVGKAGKTALDTAARSTVGQTIGRNVAQGVLGEGGAEGFGEATRQFAANPNAAFDTDAILQNALTGAVVGGAISPAGIAGDLINGQPRRLGNALQDAGRSLINQAKNGAQSVSDAAQGVVNSDPVQSAYAGFQGLQQGILDGIKNGYDQNAPEGVKNAVDALKRGGEATAKQARLFIDEIRTADDVPVEIKAQAEQLGKTLYNRSSQAGAFALKQLRDAARLTKDTVGRASTDAVSRLRSLGKQPDDLQSIINGVPLVDPQALSTAQGDAQTSLLRQATEKAQRVVSDTYSKLVQRADLTDEQRQTLAQAGQNLSDAASQAAVATIGKAKQAKDIFSRKLKALTDGISKGNVLPGEGGPKKSEDYSGFYEVIKDRIVPLIADRNPELLTDNKSINELGGTLRLTAQYLAEGNDVKVGALQDKLFDVLGPNAVDVLRELGDITTGGNQKRADAYFRGLNDLLAEDRANNNLVEVLKKIDEKGTIGDYAETARLLRREFSGENDSQKNPQQLAFDNARLRIELESRFGTKANRIYSVLEREQRESAPKGRVPGVTKAAINDDGGFNEDAGSTGEGQDPKSFYVMAGGKELSLNPDSLYEEQAQVPRLYDNPALQAADSKYEAAVKQAIDKLNVKYPGNRSYFVPLRDYGRARGLTEDQMLEISGGKNPSDVGFIKSQRVDEGDGVQDYQLRGVTMDAQYAKRRSPEGNGFVDTPDVIRVTVDGRPMPIAIDSKKVARVFGQGKSYSDFEDEGGKKARIAQQFVEGIAALTEYYGDGGRAKSVKLNVRDDHIIGKINGQAFTYGEAKTLLKNRDTVGLTKTDDLVARRTAELEAESAKLPPEARRSAERLAESKGAAGQLPASYIKAYRRLEQAKAEASVREFVQELPEKELRSYRDKLASAYDERSNDIHAALIDELDASGQRLSKAEFSKELKRRRDDENTGLPSLGRVLNTLDYDLDRRAGEDDRARVLNSENETRDGIQLSGLSNSAPEGASKAAGKFFKDFIERERRFKLNEDYLLPDGSVRTQSIKAAPDITPPPSTSGRTEADPAGNIQEAALLLNAKKLVRHNSNPKLFDQDPLVINNTDRIKELRATLNGEGVTPARAKKIEATIEKLRAEQDTLTPSGQDVLRQKIDRMLRSPVVATRQMGQDLQALAGSVANFNDSDRAAYSALVYYRGESDAVEQGMIGLVPRQAQKIVGTLVGRYGAEPAVAAAPAPAAPAKPDIAKMVDDAIKNEKWPTTVRGVEKFLKAARLRYDELSDLRDRSFKDEDVEYSDDDHEAYLALLDTFEPTVDLAINFTEASDFRDLSEAEQDRLIAFAESLNDGVYKRKEEGQPDPKAVAAKKAALLEAASSSDAALLKELRTSNDVKGLQRAVETLLGAERSPGVEAALDAANGRLSDLIGDDNVSYNLQTTSYQSAQGASATNGLSLKARKQISDIVRGMLGNSVTTEFKNLPHAGEYENSIIRISTFALNPNSVAYHESLHAFFDQLRTNKHQGIINVIDAAVRRPAVAARLRELLANEPAALKQLDDPEERAAYAFQFWAAGDAKLTAALKGEPTTVFGRVAKAIRDVLGVWSNSERAVATFEYLSSGEYARNLGQPNAVAKALLEPGRNRAIEAIKNAAKPFTVLGEEVVGAGAAVLRDSNIPALAKIADITKKRGVDTGDDAGYLPAQRLVRADYLNRITKLVEGRSEADLAQVLKTLQSGTASADPSVVGIRKLLGDAREYLIKAGVDIGDLGPDYFPRQWDVELLRKNKAAFLKMIAKYPQVSDPDHLFDTLSNIDGAEYQVVDRPGLGAKNKRLLGFISGADAEPFLNKNLLRTLDSYVSQAARRGEWSRRFADDNSTLRDLLKQAVSEGATPQQIEYTKKYLSGVVGTLGDDINPGLRQLQGNLVVYQNVRLLPLAIFSQVVDPIGIMVRGGTVGDAWSAFKRGIREIPAGLKGSTDRDAATKLAEDLGVIDNAVLQHTLGTLHTQGIQGETARRINDTFFRFNLVEQAGRSFRVGATQAAMRFIIRHADGKESPHSKRWISELGLKPGDIQTKPDGSLAVTEADGLSPEQAVRIRAAVNQWVDGAILRPDAADKPVWFNDPRFQIISHLKSFVYQFQHTILARVAHEAQMGNYTPALALTSYVPIMVAADFLKGLIQGGGEEPAWKKGWGPGDYLASGVQRAGLLGVGQFGVDAYTNVQRGGLGVAPLLGPTVEQFGDFINVVGGRAQFENVALKSLPANTLYGGVFGGGIEDPIHSN